MAKVQRLTLNDLSSVKLDQESRSALKAHSESYNEEFAICAQNFWYFAQFLRTYDEENGTFRPFPIPVLPDGEYAY